MTSPVICVVDPNLENGTLMIKDLWPNRSLANPVIDPAPQGPRYIRQPENVLPSTTGAGVVRADVNGLAAYLLCTLDRAGGGAANPTPAEAFAIAEALISSMRDGDDLEEADMNVIIAIEVGATGIGLGDSTATVANILSILGGDRFVLPAGTSVAGVYQTLAQQTALFDRGVYSPINEDDSSFWISVEQGDLYKAKNARVDPVTGVALDPLVVVYAGDGTLL